VVIYRALPPPPRVGDVEEVRRRPAGRAAAPVVAGGGAHVGVPRELLHRGDVRAPVQQVPDVGAVLATVAIRGVILALVTRDC